MNARVKGFVAGILAAVFYGTNPLGALPLYAQGINCSSVLFYRYGIAVLLFALIMLMRGERLTVRPGHAIRLATLGAVFAFSSLTLFLSFRYMDAGIASTLLFCYPIITALLMTLLFHEHITWHTALSIGLAVAGIALLYQGDGDANVSKLGFALVMTSSLLYAVYIVAVNRWTSSMSSLKFTFWVVFFGWITIFACSFLAGESIQMLHGVGQWGWAIQLGILPTVLSLFLMTVAIKHIGSTPSAILGALEPVTAVAIGVCIFDEAFTWRLAAGIVLILSGVLLIILHKDKKQSE